MFLPFLQYYFNKGKVAVMIDNERLDNLTEIFEPKNYMMTIVVGKGIAAILTIKDLDTNKDMTILCGTMYNLRESFKIASKIFNRDGVDIKLLTDFNTLAERLGDKMKEKLISLSCQHREDMLKESFFLSKLSTLR